MLIHREFSNPFPARLLILADNLITENANKPRTMGYININDYVPYPKNPKIAAVFKEIGLADELGSGIKKISKYTNIYSNGIAIFEDKDIFKVTIPLKITYKDIKIDDIKERVYHFIKSSNGINNNTLNDFIKPLLNTKTEDEFIAKRRYILDNLRRHGYIANIGAKKTPTWIAIK